MEVIPVINCPDRECALNKLRTAEQFAEWVHLDIADARFTFGKSWGSPEEWWAMGSSLRLEVHLMTEEPENALSMWLDGSVSSPQGAGAKRIIVHLEAFISAHHRPVPVDTASLLSLMRAQCEEAGASLMLAINPETSMELALPYLSFVREFQILAVSAGPPGQQFLPAALPKISFLRERYPDLRIEVDGGMNPETVRIVKNAGADAVAAGTYIFDNPDPAKAYHDLRI